MRREAKRTLFSVSTACQQSICDSEYEVFVIDNGSTEPLNSSWVESIGKNFRYIYMNYNSPSPVFAINAAVAESRANYVMCCIDGARIFSPNILSLSLQATRLVENPFIYTMGMHIGPKIQNELIEEGYDQDMEDHLLQSINWEKNTYKLFNISSLAASSRKGYFSEFNESNAFCLRKKDYIDFGGFDERFKFKGGGLANLDFFNRIHEQKDFQPILLLGEATFHQFHGGVATNVLKKEHPWENMADEYRRIRNKSYSNSYYPPLYFGKMVPEAAHLI